MSKQVVIFFFTMVLIKRGEIFAFKYLKIAEDGPTGSNRNDH